MWSRTNFPVKKEQFYSGITLAEARQQLQG